MVMSTERESVGWLFALVHRNNRRLRCHWRASSHVARNRHQASQGKKREYVRATTITLERIRWTIIVLSFCSTCWPFLPLRRRDPSCRNFQAFHTYRPERTISCTKKTVTWIRSTTEYGNRNIWAYFPFAPALHTTVLMPMRRPLSSILDVNCQLTSQCWDGVGGFWE